MLRLLDGYRLAIIEIPEAVTIFALDWLQSLPQTVAHLLVKGWLPLLIAVACFLLFAAIGYVLAERDFRR